MDICDVAVIGGGPAGMMAAIRAGGLKKEAWLLERGDSLGRKLLLSGKERCNVTNMAPLDDFMAKFGRQGDFLRTAFSRFFNQDLIDFFKVKGLELEIEEIKRYCEQDVRVTKELYDYGRRNYMLYYNTLKGDLMPIAVNFDPPPAGQNQAQTSSGVNMTLPI